MKNTESLQEEDEMKQKEELVEYFTNKFKCDICHHNGKEDIPAIYDAKTTYGMWAYLCEDCFRRIGRGLGIGKGQKLRKEDESAFK